ncbi:MAG: phosphoserine phosphatase SerB [Alphaproteobacteria bacterium]|nr:MAG: phosphoserine phosphatase SerB [Alphaproteobacteria bacterium]
MNILTLVADAQRHPLDHGLMESISALTGATQCVWLAQQRACDFVEVTPPEAWLPQLSALIAHLPIDWCIQNAEDRKKKLLVSDMDSTMIGQECIDEIADMIGIKEHVAAITERAMQGELDFATSLRSRVALLHGLPINRLEDVWYERITPNLGAKELIATMHHHGATTMLVSGGFTFFTQKVSDLLGFTHHHANVLLHHDGALTGEVTEPILDHLTKRSLLLEAQERLNLTTSQVLAVGDGANDAAMIEVAGLGVAYYAKPFLQQHANACIKHTDLRTLLYWQGYDDDAITSY